MSKLGDILQEEVLAEINEILADADTRAEMIKHEAEKKASARLAAHGRRMEAESRAAARRAESAAELAVSTARTQARGRVIAHVRRRALAALEGTAGRPDYGEILLALAEEAMDALETAEAVVVHPNDEIKLREWAARKGLELRTDPSFRLGVRIVTDGGKRSVENSLPERLRRAWEGLAPGVAQRLWG